MKSRLVFLDANVIIEAHKIGVWANLVGQFEVCVPSYILDNEVQYFTSSRGQTVQINLSDDEKAGKITRETGTPDDFHKLYSDFNQVFVDSLDAGEKEALALLYSGRFEEHRFCSADGLAIKALSVMNLQFQGVSFETLMSESGKTLKGSKKHYLEDFFKKHLATGHTERDLLKKK